MPRYTEYSDRGFLQQTIFTTAYFRNEWIGVLYLNLKTDRLKLSMAVNQDSYGYSYVKYTIRLLNDIKIVI